MTVSVNLARRMSQILTARVDGSSVVLELNSGVLRFEDLWLRDNCRCASCYSSGTFQRLIHIVEVPQARIEEVTAYSTPNACASVNTTATAALNIPPDLAATHDTGESSSALKIKWSDGHESSYSVDFLQKYSPNKCMSDRRRHHHTLWRCVADIDEMVARVSVADFLGTNEGARGVFKSLLEYGVAFVKGVQADLQSTEAVCQALGGVQNTLFGGMWQFTSVPSHADTAYTTLPLAPHTDSTYFTESTGLQILHCVEHSKGRGGETVLVDGFFGASLLRDTHPEHFSLLTTLACEAEYIEPGNHHRHAAPVIRIDRHGDLEQVRFNVYDRSPMAFESPEQCRSYYAAMRALSQLYQDRKNQWWFKLTPGSVLIIDNWRVLHGRSAFSGRRVMCGSYVARSDWLCRARVLGLLK